MPRGVFEVWVILWIEKNMWAINSLKGRWIYTEMDPRSQRITLFRSTCLPVVECRLLSMGLHVHLYWTHDQYSQHFTCTCAERKHFITFDQPTCTPWHLTPNHYQIFLRSCSHPNDVGENVTALTHGALSVVTRWSKRCSTRCFKGVGKTLPRTNLRSINTAMALTAITRKFWKEGLSWKYDFMCYP